jgi:Ricin-type beta-trefoil lectin domain
MVMLVMMVGLAVSGVLIATMLTQDRVTVYTSSHMRSLSAAQAGVNVLVGKIRAATSTGQGDPSKLPCATSTTPVTGAVDSQAKMSYSVYVTYYVVDPAQNPPPQPMLCVPGAGTYDRGTATSVPRFALITATGRDSTYASNGASQGRTLVTTYVMKTINSNVAGGQLRLYPVGGVSSELCMDAMSTTPAVGAAVTMQPCSTTVPIAAQQQFSYRSDLTLQLNTSITGSISNAPNGLCLATSANALGVPSAGDPVVLLACNALGSPPYNQQWSFNDSGAFEASKSVSSTTGVLSRLCMTVASNTITVLLAGCTDGTYSPTQAWVPSPNVGDGAAAPPQLVNFQQFGRCADVTNQDVNSDHLIAYPCKQNPLPTAVAWNQKFQFDATKGWLYTTYGGTQYCLFSPRTEGGWVRATQCAAPSWVAGVSASQLVWSSLGSAATTSYTQRYTYVDSSNRCLSIASPPPGSASGPWYYVVVAACDGSTVQKWNADADLTSTTLQNTQEK